MNILELDSYNLGDAVKFNERLNPRIWGPDEKLLPEVREHLLQIAADFQEFLGINDIELKDITVSGSNAAFTYTPHSDIDLHLVVDLPEADRSEVYRELFDAKKYQYNELHNIKIGGYDVELYVQNANEPHISQGIYSVINNNWVSVPKRRKPDVDDISTRSKYETLSRHIDQAIKSKDHDKISAVVDKIKRLRQAGLETHGEFGPENLAFKMLRTQGKIKQLYAAMNAAKDQQLSLDEQKKPAPKKFTYGFKTEDVGMTWDGVSPTTAMFTTEESSAQTDEEVLKDFVDFCVKELKIKQLPIVKLRKDPQWSVVNKTFGRYVNDRNLLEVAWGQRHIMDVLRTVAHELTHRRQHEREDVPASAGETGSEYENEANARAGILMRDWARLHPDLFDNGQAELDEDILDENVRDTASALAVMTCLIAGGSLSGCATQPQQTTQQYLKTTQDIGRTVQTAKNITRASTSQEVKKELETLAQARGGDPGAANTSNILRLWHKLKGRPAVPQQAEPPEYGPPMPTPRMPQYESASGYIPTKKQAKDPRYSMALTVDIKPGQVGKEANKLGLKTDKQGHPQIARASGLVEALTLELAKFKKGIEEPWDRDGYEPPGPEFEPEWPEGTTKIDVADLTDWYQLGMDISDLDDADPKNYSKGPPQTVVVFPSDEMEQPFLKQFKRLGLKSHDIDKGQEHLHEEQLDEVRMSPSSLMQWAKSDAARGIRSGFEAELIFRDTVNADDGEDMEPDYDADERCRSIQQIIDFFNNGDYGGLSPRQESALQNGLDEQYFEWQDEQMYDAFRDEASDLVRDIWLEEKPMDERIHAALVDGLDLTDEQADAVVELHDKRGKKEITGAEMSEEQLDMAQQYSEARSIAEDVLDEDVQTSIDKQDGYYDQALDNFREDFYVDDDSGFFDDIGLRWMSDVAEGYDLDWPYLTGSSNSGSRDWEGIGDSLNDAIGMQVKVSSGYHSATRKPDLWIIEPDSSLNPDDSDDYGLEVVSPPMPLLTALEKLQQVCDWANNPNQGNAYTNESTGLHMGVSVPYKGGDVDYLKLILFLGDEYVLKSFGREANSFTKSAMSKFKENIKGGRTDPMSVIKLMQHGLLELAQREVQKGVGTGKYTSAHIQNGYIEFRSAGGDWLAEESADPEKLSSTMLRYARAMQIAANPAEERKEYAKKLYKLVAPEGDTQLALFSQFAAGELTAEQLKKQWAEKTLGVEKKMNQRWKLYKMDNGVWTAVPGAEWNGYTEDQAKNAVWSKYGREALDSGEYQLVNMGEQEWEVYDVKTGKTLEIVKGKSKGEVADAVYDKYVNQGIGFQVRPYEDPNALTPRAKLAKRIVQPKQQPAQPSTNPNPTVQDAGQVRMPNGMPVWEVYDKETGSIVNQLADHTMREAHSRMLAWLSSVGAEDPATYVERFGVRPKMLQAGERNLSPSISENFADGKGPGRPGDSQRHGIPKGATIAQLEKAAKAPGRKGQLARWQLNMRRGKKK